MLRAGNNIRRPSNNVEENAKLAHKTGNGPLKPLNQLSKPVLAKPVAVVQNDPLIKSQRINLQDNEIKCLEMASDIYKYLVHHEKKFVLDENYMDGGEPTSKMRRILVDWLVQVHLRFHLTPETLHLTKVDLQLLGISAMFVASKFEEVFLPDIYDYEFITENAFNKKQILGMEQTILNTLEFDLSCPSSLVFARCLSRVLSEDESNPVDQQAFYYAYNICKCIGELALLDSVIASIPKSHIAIASMIIALNVYPVDGIDPKKAEKACIEKLGADKEEIADAVGLLAQVACKNFKQPKLVAIKSKYQSTKLGQASNLLTDAVLEKIEAMGRQVDME
uniref:Cyclin N-terminal domain-containing protein n=1 Tax=Caenorhabditis tropicalis TaxID=1561998 RepID=A0A1I7UN87_9PELO